MQVVAVDVLVLENKIRLVAETEFFQILAGYILQFRIGQRIVRMRVERNMQHRLLHLICGGMKVRKPSIALLMSTVPEPSL